MLENHVLNTGKPVKLIERSIFSARYCFVENMYRTEKMLGCEYEVLDEWFKFATKDSALDLKVDLIIYLKTTPEKVILHFITFLFQVLLSVYHRRWRESTSEPAVRRTRFPWSTSSSSTTFTRAGW